jgi:D-alanyl-D-alanine carboxypeptidase/D-alanyl-D-alanine-endopeptidase (penicillin-binding protein 4)
MAALAVLGAVLALALVRPAGGPALPATGPSPPASPEPEPVAVLPAAGAGAPAPTAAGVQAAIDELVRGGALGEAVSVAVVDALTGQRLYGHQPDRPTVPASTIKLVTAATVLAALGPEHRLATVAVAGAEPAEVVLVGGGDPTLAAGPDGFYPGAARLDRLAGQVRAALGDRPVSRVTVDATAFRGPRQGPWTEDIQTSGFVGPITALMTDGGRIDPDPEQDQRPSARYQAPDLAAGEVFAELLGAPAGAVTRGPAPARPPDLPARPGGRAQPPAPGTELGRVSSPPLQRLVEIMLVSSDNVVAEALARQVALAAGEPASFAGAAAAMAAGLDRLGVPLRGGELADGSGLSRDNRLTASLLTELVARAAGRQQPHAGLLAALPVAGWSGTLADRYRSPQPRTTAGAGLVRAKTGSLNRVDALAGMVTTAEGRVLAFAVLADDVPVDQSRARTALDRIASTLAGCGCR